VKNSGPEGVGVKRGKDHFRAVNISIEDLKVARQSQKRAIGGEGIVIGQRTKNGGESENLHITRRGRGRGGKKGEHGTEELPWTHESIDLLISRNFTQEGKSIDLKGRGEGERGKESPWREKRPENRRREKTIGVPWNRPPSSTRRGQKLSGKRGIASKDRSQTGSVGDRHLDKKSRDTPLTFLIFYSSDEKLRGQGKESKERKKRHKKKLCFKGHLRSFAIRRLDYLNFIFNA